MSAKSSATLQITPSCSRQLTIISGGLQGLAVLAVLLLAINHQPLYVALLLPIYFTVRQTWQQLHATTYQQLALHQDRRVVLITSSDNCVTGKVADSTVVTTAFVLLHVLVGKQVIAIPLFRDSLPAEDFRQLRVFLRTLPYSD